MSRRNESHISNSKAASIAFRQKDLRGADIFFQPHSYPCPPKIAELKAYLLALPDSLRLAESADEVIKAVRLMESDVDSIYSNALQDCQKIDGAVVESCSLQHERVWMRRVNEPALAVFFHAVQARLLSSTEDYLWTEGRETSRNQSAETLYDPKPDVAIGLQPRDSSTFSISNRHTWPALSDKALHAMSQYAPLSLIYSPSQRFDIVYPAVIYEAKSDSNPILWAENQAAVGVARALGLLEDLSRLAGSPSIPPVIAITSAGPMWQVHIAFVSPDGSINLVPLLDQMIGLRNFNQRFRVLVILHRLFQWMINSFHSAVENHLKQVWANYLEQVIPSLHLPSAQQLSSPAA